MKIMFVSAAFPPCYTGIGAYTYNMAKAITAIGHQVVVATCKVDALPEIEESDAGTILRCYSWQDLRTESLAKRLLRIARQYQIDLIECADFLGEGGWLLRSKSEIPICIKAHNSGPVRIGREAENYYFWQRWMQWAAILRNWSQYRDEKYSIEHGDILVTPSARLMVELEKQGFDLPETRFVQPNPICLPEVEPQNKESADPTLLFVGRLAIGKGIAFLPALMEKLIPAFPGIKLVIAGDDSYARGLGSLRKWLSRRMGSLTANVEFTGQLGREELTGRYDESWLVLVPSLWDTFPTVVLEAMSRAKPVVASVYGGMSEMLDNTLCKAIMPQSVDFPMEVCRLLSDRELRLAAGESMWRKARETYAPEVVAEQYLDQLMDKKLSTS